MPDKKFYSPELENLKKSLLVQDWFKTPYSSLFQEQYERLSQPVNIQPWTNLAKQMISSQTKAGIQEATKAAGQKGFAPGESGIADRAILNAIRSGQAAAGQAAQGIASQAEELGLAKSQAATQALTSGLGSALNALQSGAGLEQWGQQFELGQLMSFLNALLGVYSGEQQQQLARYSPYWSALSQIYSG